ncbi:hypothetical protein TraAM80_06835 [Trypanosoma rangeli]|uniref:Uncharacterized protein n=1 Tax=Trypanosoma rangeli TaxID=5698 RepID=A0A3R7M953_TRYRA|nr:uncharacterized protein TraAM80_06835 [Trypanosoma rangeli]RNF01667.1 hypothetical protein TraAM80_06835 [Trypanosoma rangeli]|eukprot:RNF01667.1 hypothetical protein TraAM80_06835 [Trypanosoma rangeli]
MRCWSPWRRVAEAAATATIHRQQFLTGGISERRATAGGSHGVAKYCLPLRRPLHFFEKGIQLSAFAAKKVKDTMMGPCAAPELTRCFTRMPHATRPATVTTC